MDVLPSWLRRRPSCPASPAEKQLVEDGFQSLQEQLGPARLRDATVVEPTPAFFPDRYDASPDAAEQLFVRICGYMRIEPHSVRLSFWQEELEKPEVHAPGTIGAPRQTRGATGYYAHMVGFDHVSVNVAELTDPEALVATMVHELAHLVLLGRCAMSHDEPHMEALTDLTTIYLGLGIFTSNTLLRRHGWTHGNVEGWKVSRKGYISPEMAGWALSLFAWARGERNPKWSQYLAVDPKSYLKQGLRYLDQTGDTSFCIKPPQK
jgi:hypothetical protein